MRLLGLVVMAVVALAACGSEPADELARCEEVRADWAALLASMDRSCDDASDCDVIGTVTDNCDDVAPPLGSCSGDAVNAEAASARQADVTAIEARWGGCRTSVYCDDLGGCDLDCNFGRVLCQAGRCVSNSSCLGLVCDPVLQVRCSDGEKCSWLRIDTPNNLGSLWCVPDGSVAAGDACEYGPDGESSGYDDCVAGAICIDGTCRAICSASSDGCTAPSTCVVHPEVFAGASGIGGCE